MALTEEAARISGIDYAMTAGYDEAISPELPDGRSRNGHLWGKEPHYRF